MSVEFSGLVRLQSQICSDMNTTVGFLDTWVKGSPSPAAGATRALAFCAGLPRLPAPGVPVASANRQPSSQPLSGPAVCFSYLASAAPTVSSSSYVEEAAMGCRVPQHSTPKSMPTRAVVLLTGRPERRHRPVDCGKPVDAWSSALTRREGGR